MKQLFLIIMFFSLLTNANNKNKEVYKSIMMGLSSIGENLEKQENKEQILISKITSLLSWNESANDEKIILSSGVFAMLALEKKNLKDPFEIKNYTDIFSTDSNGSSFLYKDYIVTNYHMCRGLNTLIRDYKNNVYAVKVLSYNIKQDICILMAPEKVKDQRNFKDFKIKKDLVLEQKEFFKLKDQLVEIEKKSKKSRIDMFNIEKIKLLLNKNENQTNQAQISGAYGEFPIYKIEKDLTIDEWSKKNAYMAYGSKCKGGVSGSPVVSTNGIIGLFWGAEDSRSFYKRVKQIRNPSAVENNPLCYFIDIKEVDLLIQTYEESLKK